MGRSWRCEQREKQSGVRVFCYDSYGKTSVVNLLLLMDESGV